MKYLLSPGISHEQIETPFFEFKDQLFSVKLSQ